MHSLSQYRRNVVMLLIVLLMSSVFAQEPVYWDVVDKIMEEALDNSQVQNGLETGSKRMVSRMLDLSRTNSVPVGILVIPQYT